MTLARLSFLTIAFLISCTKTTDSSPEAPTVVTGAITQVTSHTAMVSGEVTSVGDSEVTDRGVCIFTTPSPTPSDMCISAGEGIGSFTVTVAGLDSERSYSVRAYATSAVGTSYGNPLSFATLPITVTDVDGNTYATVQIGSQRWMKENLKTTKYANGELIPSVQDAAQWVNLSTGAWMQGISNTLFGKLYNYYAVEHPAGLCPTGWHVPTKEEWTVLTDFLGGANAAGGKMKSTGTREDGTGLWISPNNAATNSSGFTGLPAGQRGVSGSPLGPVVSGQYGHWWSRSMDTETLGWGLSMFYNNGIASGFGYDRRIGKTVRCLMD